VVSSVRRSAPGGNKDQAKQQADDRKHNDGNGVANAGYDVANTTNTDDDLRSRDRTAARGALGSERSRISCELHPGEHYLRMSLCVKRRF
jgi:hypothetical protein